MICCFALSNHHKLPAFTLSIPPQRSWRYMFSWETQNCGACSVLSVTDGGQPPTDWGSLWQEQAPPPPSTSTDCCKSYHAFPLSEASPWLQTCYVGSCDYRLHPDLNQTAEILTKLNQIIDCQSQTYGGNYVHKNFSINNRPGHRIKMLWFFTVDFQILINPWLRV